MARSRLRTGVMIGGEQLEEVTEYKYLERLVTSANEISTEIGSINENFYSASIPGEARLSGATAKSVFNSKIKEAFP